MPAEQHVGPVHPLPPHCPHIPEQGPVPADVVVEVAKVVLVLDVVVVVVTGGGSLIVVLLLLLLLLVVEVELVLMDVPASKALRIAL